ncbi:nucleotidyl transferase AbiEii/AbiGii toxin family protein [Streptomyces rhizosphaericus]|uniref:nucleotidyl transferase AbiEii/AbiGii toxin family protein n=1 Tax=Streptomyces rhizosphaericus TaxID=114699 RepID=UPI000A39D77F|nr:nucleotidyl transferase AbiEii/AbiGii toxin family protein [Streptomyces rhizosphaericus]
MARESYKKPAGLHSALKHTAQRLADQEGLSVAGLLSNYYASRLAARLFHLHPDGWMIKGGTALLLRYGTNARLSRGLDVQHAGTDDISEAVANLLEAAAHPLDDGFRFTPTRLRMYEHGAPGARQLFDVHVGSLEVARALRVNVVSGHRPVARPEIRRLEPLIKLARPMDWPEVKLYSIADQLADKICGLYKLYRGSPSTRFRDLADILLIGLAERLDGRQVQQALRAEAQRLDVVLPQSFRVPGPAWPAGYLGAAEQVPGLKGHTAWAEAAAAVDALLTPLLAPGPPGDWSPTEAAWHVRPPRDDAMARLRAIAFSIRMRPAIVPHPHPPVRGTHRRSLPARPALPPPPASGPGMAPGR